MVWTFRLAVAFLLTAAVAPGSSKPVTHPVQVDVVMDWSPFTLEVGGKFNPRTLSMPLTAQGQTHPTARAKLEIMRVRKAPRARLIEYAISGPPSGMFHYTLKSTVDLLIGDMPPPPGNFGSIFIPPAPDRFTSVKRGAEFADVKGLYGAPMGILTILSAQQQGRTNRVVLRSESGKSIALSAPANNVYGLRGLLPIENDSNVVQLRHTFRRGRAWALGKVGMYCGGQPNPMDSNKPNLQVIDDRSIAIKKIIRVHGFVVSDIASGSPDSWGAERGFHFSAIDPIVIVYKRTWPRCASSFWILADTWQVKRFFSPLSLDEAHPEWSASIRSALKLERVRPGMTHQMVAWARGYPLDYGSVEALNTKQRWDYETDAKYAQWAIFKNDRLVYYIGTGGWPP